MYSLAAMALLKTDVNSGVLMSLNRIKKDGLKVGSFDQGLKKLWGGVGFRMSQKGGREGTALGGQQQYCS